MVLLENHGVLPLERGRKIALYGYGARHTVTCGLGSASFTDREVISVEEGLRRVGMEIVSMHYLDDYTEMIQREEAAYYDAIREKAKGDLLAGVMEMYAHPLIPQEQPLIGERDLEEAVGSDTAIYVISRFSGEGADRRMTEGDYLLWEREKENLRILADRFSNLIVLLNVGGVMDTSFFRELSHLDALLLIGQGGGVTGLAVADVMTGVVVPEGKLTDTWANRYEDYPNADSFGEQNGNLFDEYYSEGIYVGYRYFDSFGIVPNYPFGYGLSYTTFGMELEEVRKESREGSPRICLRIKVTNQGDRYAGRETVQVYISAPIGEIEQPYQELRGFSKTGLLAPRQSETVTIEIPITEMASYQQSEAAWLLERGEYLVRIGNSSRNTKVAAVIEVEERILCVQCRNLFETEEKAGLLALGLKDDSKLKEKRAEVLKAETLPMVGISQKEIEFQEIRYRNKMELFGKMPGVLPGKERREEQCLRFEEVKNGSISLNTFIQSLSAEELIYLCVGNAGEEEEASIVCGGGASSSTEYEMEIVPGACDTTRMLLENRGIPNLFCADGASGVRVLPQYEVDKDGILLTPGLLSVRNVDKIIGKDSIQDRENRRIGEQYTTGIPIAMMLAQTWDVQLWQECGEIEGSEMQEYHISIWLAPALNIHRNPLGGRNFEYYSEDPLLSGKCAAAVTRGVQRYRGVCACAKHFACNNQEANRHGSNAHISERALREIYLRGFEICVREGKPLTMMSSYNLINGIHSACNYDLLTAVARDEWGFDGLVMTDWGATSASGDRGQKYRAATCAESLMAGNDLMMPGALEDIRSLQRSVRKGEIELDILRQAARRILRVMLRLQRE